MEKTYTCIVCPRGCRIRVIGETTDAPETLLVTGHTCRRGEEYARQEHTDPRRNLTSTVCVTGAKLTRLPVMTSCPVPKGKIPEIQEQILTMEVQAPIQCGEVLVKGIAGTEADLIASRTIK